MSSRSQTNPGAHEFGLTFDETAWPLLYVRYPSKPLSDEGFEHFITRYTGFVERREHFATVFDSRGPATAITAAQRKRLTEWFEVTGPLANEFHFGIALLISSSLIRGALNAVTWLAPIPVPVKSFGSIADAAPWVHDIFAAQGLPVTPSMGLLLRARG